MKKLFCMIALAAISFGSVYAHGAPAKTRVKAAMQVDTTKKKKKKMKKDSTQKKKDTTAVKTQK